MKNELWSVEKITLLKELWAADLTAAQISVIMEQRGMPTNKNAIYKKSRRLGLTPRESPIITVSTDKTRKDMTKAPRPTPEPQNQAPSNPVLVSDKSPILLKMAKYERGEGCCWPIGDPKKDDFRFCGKTRLNRNYCKFHKGIAYRPMECA